MTAEGLNSCNAIAAPTAAFARIVKETYDLPKPLLWIYNGRCAPTSSELQTPYNRSHFIMTAGRLWDEGKNIAALDRAAALIDTPVMAAGPREAPHGGSVELNFIRSLGALGEAELRGWLAKAPVYASTAVYEPFGLGVLEAAQAGCALVLSDIPTFRELWSGAALFVPPHDDAAIAATLHTVILDQGLRNSLSERAQHRAQRFSIEAMAGDMARLYEGLLQNSHVPSEVAA